MIFGKATLSPKRNSFFLDRTNDTPPPPNGAVAYDKETRKFPATKTDGALAALDGWTLPDKESAFRKLQELLSAQKKESANPVKKSPIQNSKRCSESIKLRGDVKGRRDG